MGVFGQITDATTRGLSNAGKALSQILPNSPAKTTIMPLPANDGVTKDVREVTFARFNTSGIPALEDVKQAHSLANCPVAAILAAFAFTVAGRTFIQGIVPAPISATVLTDISGLPSGTLTNPPSGTTISSSRYFTVTLPSGPVDVSDVMYTDDASSGWSLIYMQDPADRSIWAPVIEKALAVSLGSYENFDALNLSANDFWQRITGVAPGGFAIDGSTPLTQITQAAQASINVPTIGASKEDDADVSIVSAFHGFAMIGTQGSKIHLYDPAKATKILLTPAEFRHDFQAILFRT